MPESILPPGRDKACLVSTNHHRFTLYDPRAAVEFTNLIEIRTLELPKIPETPDVYLWNWLRFLRAETKPGDFMGIRREAAQAGVDTRRAQ